MGEWRVEWRKGRKKMLSSNYNLKLKKKISHGREARQQAVDMVAGAGS